ncbi:hypothetical protein SAMN02745673_01492 [Marinactinospora thermotolerans DSM 45154]|uniref:Uncharacterized protein n=1 Tax=Marinactinospora thermotolerans DSM 45154 TaxID=1122192 RepID=A0A1T4NLE9_9ACTN|nr:hypothetical protein SAMN02745673_01492 [Marinactinospora thermotolerans DSM 45154]
MTRHLCAGTYVDRPFRDLVIRKVHNAPYRRVAPSYGFDLVPVLRHAWHAWALETTLLAAVPGILLLTWSLGHRLAATLAATGFILCSLLLFILRTAPEIIRLKVTLTAEEWQERTRKNGRWNDSTRLRKRIRWLKASLGAGAATSIFPWIASRLLNESLESALPGLISILFGVVMLAATIGAIRQLLLNHIHANPTLRPSSLTSRERAVDAQQFHGCTVYRRPEGRGGEEYEEIRFLSPEENDLRSPFIGSGELVHRWIPPLTVQLLRPGNEGMTQRRHNSLPFNAHELVDHLRTTIKGLDSGTGSGRMRGLQVTDRVYVAETDVSKDRSLLTEPLTPDRLAEIIDNPDEKADHFLVITAPYAEAELITTVFLRVSIKSRTLSLEFSSCALTRTLDDHRKIDAYAEHGKLAVARSALREVVGLPSTIRRTPRLIQAPIFLICALWSRKDRSIRPRRGIHIGPRISIRENASQDWLEISQRDHDVIFDQMKIIEQWILKATEEFLETHEVDTSTFKKQAVNIINSGVLNMGGKTEVNNSAIGRNSRTRNESSGKPDDQGNQSQDTENK